jgi:energy-coupling factor transporter transmembrane protein EcfT
MSHQHNWRKALNTFTQTNQLDPRLKILSLVLMSVSHSIAFKTQSIALLLVTTVFFIALNYKDIHQYVKILLLLVLTLIILSLLSWFFDKSVTTEYILMNFFRWLSVSTFSLAIFYSLNSLEIIVALRWFKIPIGLAVALGTGIRFLPVIIEDARRVYWIMINSNNVKNKKNFIEKGIIFISDFVQNLIVSFVRSIDDIIISITIQDLEQRINDFQFNNFDWINWFLLIVFIIAFLHSLYFFVL